MAKRRRKQREQGKGRRGGAEKSKGLKVIIESLDKQGRHTPFFHGEIVY